MDRRRAELEEKRRKLEEMKRAREERMSATAALRKSVAPGAQTPYRGNNRQQVDDLLNNILGQPTPSVAPAASASRPESSLPPRTPGLLYRNQGVQETQETPPERTSGAPEAPAPPQQRSISLQ